MRIRIFREVDLPDPVQLARFESRPDLGPSLLFFSGGTALKSFAQKLIHYTHNSIHIITPFDSGGSSAEIRKAFGMLAVGDIRNRLMALADQSLHGYPEIYELFAYRMSKTKAQEKLVQELTHMSAGKHPLVAAIRAPMRKIIRNHLLDFRERMPEDFDLRGASIGNLVLTGGFLAYRRHIDPVIYIFSKLVQARGVVRPTVNSNLHMAATLENGRRIVGQHNLTGKEVAPIDAPLASFELVKSLEDPAPAQVEIRSKMRKLIRQADLVVYPIGSFYSSLIANFLPRGVGRAVAGNPCPKVYVPNTAKDPEAVGLNVNDQIKLILQHLQADAPGEIQPGDLLNFVLLDEDLDLYPGLDLAAMERMGVRPLCCKLMEPASRPFIQSEKLAQVLLSLS
ncbi:MAG: GAK system CofD-like protein [Desulfovibrionaceae bacterium]